MDTMLDTSSLAAQLCEEAQTIGVQVSDDQTALMVKHLGLVIEKNKVLNLTRIVDEHDAVTKHLVDSLLFVKAYEHVACPQGRFLDLGTGAGFPGIPFGIMTGREGTLLDSVGKKVQAVQEFVDALGLGERLEAVTMRVEELAAKRKGQYACVTARAVAELNVLLEYAAPLLRKDGLLVVSKGRLSDEELKNGTYAAKVCGFEIVSRETSELPHEAGHREMLIYRKVRKPEIKLPRNVGMAKHKPLVNS